MKNRQFPVKNSFSLLLCTLFLCFSALTGCSDDNEDPGRTGWVRVLPLEVEFSAMGGEQNITLLLTDDIKPADLVCAVAANGEDWCSVELAEDVLKVKADPTYYEYPRTTIVTVSYGDLQRDIPVSQAASSGSADIKIAVASAKATTEETESEDRGIKYSFDGDYESYFNSKFGAFSDWPFIIDYTFKSASKLDYIVYHPRTDKGTRYGAFNEFNVYVATADAPATWEKVAECARGDQNYNATTIKLEKGVENVQKVRFEINSAHNNRISCAEMDFFQTSMNKFDYTTVFTDETCSALKEGITEKDIKKMPGEMYKKLATALLSGTYDTKYRVAEYRPYQNPAIMASKNKTNKYSLRDNPTGIYAEAGEKITVLVGEIYKNGNLSMIIQDLNGGYNNFKTYSLQEGSNEITVEVGGLIYILNHVDDDIPLLLEDADANQKKIIEEKTVKVHFVYGKVNGYFDILKNTESDWKEILNNATYQDIDVLGRYSHITWTVADFKKNNTEITKSIENTDRLVYLEQDFLGLVKYGKMFNNRMHLCVDYKAVSPNATDYRTVYSAGDYYAEPFCIPERFGARCWGPAHEVGHCNQTRPGMKWAGLTEVTNNIMSLHIQTSFGEPSKIWVEGYYKKAVELFKTTPHCVGYSDDIYNNCYEKLTPFWQLKLYMIDALGQKDFYRDLYEHYRVTPDLNTSTLTQGILQLDFVRQACNLSKLNLLKFFKDMGFLTPVDMTLKDYGTKPFKITQKQIDDLKAEIEAHNYPLAPDDLYLITDENYNTYTAPAGYGN